MNDELKRFLVVAQTGNVTQAAQKVFITQSALTQSIQRLEKELNTKLFSQQGKQLHLTEDGKALVVIGEKMAQLWSNALDPNLRKTHKQIVSVGIFDNVALRLGKFFQDHRETDTYQLELTIDSSGKLLTKLQLGTLDAALCILNKAYALPNHIVLSQTYSEELIPVSSKSFSQELSKIPFILYNKGSNTRVQIDEIFNKQGIIPTVYAESTSVTFMRELAILGGGVALLPENFVKDDINQGRLKIQKMPLQWHREYGLLIQKNSDLQNSFIAQLQSALTHL
jgi:DNA-binding transcriptional LysR family regulator